MINFAHRGASAYAPENTMVSFRMGLDMGANGIETDVQRSKDGVLVLYHDDTLKRTLNKEGSICDYTWEELQGFDAGSFKDEKYRGEKLVRLEDFLREFGSRNPVLAIEIKQRGVEYETLDMVRKYVDDDHFTITSFMLDVIKNLGKRSDRPQLGYLTRDYSEELLDDLTACGVCEYCPDAAVLTSEMIDTATKKGLRVRAWGVSNEELMNRMVDLGVYGMTVNFPDLLAKRLNPQIV